MKNWDWKRITAISMLVDAILLIAYDIYIEGWVGDSDTISKVFLSYAHDYPVIPFAWGLLTGHLLASQKDPYKPQA